MPVFDDPNQSSTQAMRSVCAPARADDVVTGAGALPAIPQAVVERMVLHGHTPVQAWRTHLGLTQRDVAARLGIAEPAYAALEAKQIMDHTTLVQMARAIGVQPEVLDV